MNALRKISLAIASCALGLFLIATDTNAFDLPFSLKNKKQSVAAMTIEDRLREGRVKFLGVFSSLGNSDAAQHLGRDLVTGGDSGVLVNSNRNNQLLREACPILSQNAELVSLLRIEPQNCLRSGDGGVFGYKYFLAIYVPDAFDDLTSYELFGAKAHRKEVFVPVYIDLMQVNDEKMLESVYTRLFIGSDYKVQDFQISPNQTKELYLKAFRGAIEDHVTTLLSHKTAPLPELDSEMGFAKTMQIHQVGLVDSVKLSLSTYGKKYDEYFLQFLAFDLYSNLLSDLIKQGETGIKIMPPKLNGQVADIKMDIAKLISNMLDDDEISAAYLDVPMMADRIVIKGMFLKLQNQVVAESKVDQARKVRSVLGAAAYLVSDGEDIILPCDGSPKKSKIALAAGNSVYKNIYNVKKSKSKQIVLAESVHNSLGGVSERLVPIIQKISRQTSQNSKCF
ncbi:hypothetical protein V5T82_15080 [Magnetovibrio sp. PR-2]|uniref:hypothetical protein n=1 Tax=Magnetovibrio sp. PR-2 TaxID=3120356 RepID=UPI002FCE59CC